MKSLLVVVIFFASNLAFAAPSSESAFNDTDHSIHGAVGFSGGGIALGADYERRKDRTYGWGGYVRLFQEDDDVTNAAGLTAIGAFMRPHFHRRAWDLSVTAGFGIHIVKSPDGNNGRDDETALGPVFGVGLYYQYNDTMALGAEQMSYYGWFADDFRGQIEQVALFKMRWNL